MPDCEGCSSPAQRDIPGAVRMLSCPRCTGENYVTLSYLPILPVPFIRETYILGPEPAGSSRMPRTLTFRDLLVFSR